MAITITMVSYAIFYAERIASRVADKKSEAGILGKSANLDRTNLDWEKHPKKKTGISANEQGEIAGLTSIEVAAGLAVSQLNRDLPHQAPEEVLRFPTCVAHDALPYPVASSF